MAEREPKKNQLNDLTMTSNGRTKTKKFVADPHTHTIRTPYAKDYFFYVLHGRGWDGTGEDGRGDALYQ